ncbi:MAG: amidohydrolase family protein [Rhizobiaceae bacterium]
MIVDWMTNLWDRPHLRPDMEARDASPERHRRDVVGVADRFVVTTLEGRHLGINVPNDYVASYVREHGDRAIGLATVNPRAPGAEAELRRAVTELGLRGLKLAPTFQDFDPWCEEAWRIYELADSLGIPIYWHQSSGGAQAPLEYADPLKLDRVARTYPNMKMILEHFALPWGNIGVALVRKHPNMYIDVCARVVRQWDMYNCLRLAMDYGVTDKVLFASDFPIQTPEEALASLRVFATDALNMPPIPSDIIEAIIHDRPLSLVWPED